MLREHQSQTQGCRSMWQGKERLQSVPTKSQQPLKYFQGSAAFLSLPGTRAQVGRGSVWKKKVYVPPY